ncbi:MAG: sulfotransferase domain-containing protein [Desulfamplus sp.]|nr:sulfotransferase domain-containing protein [Desulfamplus sp.]
MNSNTNILETQVPISIHDPDDFFIVAYPKSGITWFQHLMSGIIYDVDLSTIRFGEVNDLIPDVHYKSSYIRKISPMFFKSHSTPKPEYRNVIYIIRDGRDVTVSFFHHYLQKFPKDNVNYTKIINGYYANSTTWAKHVESWLENPFNANLLIIKYEHLLNNPINTLKKVCEFTKKQVTDKKLQTIVEVSSFNNLKQKEHSWGMDNPSWPQQNTFFRKGVVGDYKNELPQKNLEQFLSLSQNTLTKINYK